MTPIEATAPRPRRPTPRALLERRFPRAVLGILAFLVAFVPVELRHFPERADVLLLVLGLELGASSAALLLARAARRSVRNVVTGWAVSIVGLEALYLALVGADATVAMAAFVALVVAIGVLLPIPLRHHLMICAACWAGVGALYLLGAPASLPWSYLALGFLALTVLSCIGVASVDRVRIGQLRREAALRRAERALRAALGRAQSAVEQRSRLLADVSHEFRTPVNVILGYADMLLDGSPSPAERAEMIRRIRDYGASLEGLVSRLLDLSRLGTGRIELARDRVALDDLVEEVADSARVLVGDKPVRIDAACSGGSIETDGLRLRQILHNLISNAVRATERGEIAIRAQRRGSRCLFTVSDTGCGIAEEKHEQIFAAFERLGGGSDGGIGLGLAIVRQLAELLGGEVRVESAPGRGAVFTVDLPAAHLREAPSAPAESAVA